MSAIAFLRELLDAGLDLDAALIAAEKFERKALEVIEARKAKDRERKKAPRIPRNSTETTERQEIQETPPPPSFPPEPPQTPTPTRECITTRGEREREDAGFAKFWAAYPRKTAKADARKAFTKAWRKLPPFDEEAILSGGLERAKAAWTDAQFIPHAATWLNGERWQDEPTIIHLRRPNERPHDHPAPTAREDRLGRMLRGALAAVDEREPKLG